MRKSKGRKTGKAAKKDDAQNGEPEVDSNEVDEENEEDSSSGKKKAKAGKRSSSRNSEVKNYNEDEAEQSNEEENEENEDNEDSKPLSNKKSKKRKPASKKGGKKAKAAESEEKSDEEEEESLPKKPKKGRKAAAQKNDEESSDDEASQEEYEVERIIDVYFKKNGEKEFLVRWKGYSAKEDTWEPEANLNCKDLIESYLKKCEEARSATQRETRVHRKTTDRYIVNAQDTGRKLSSRHKGKPRKTYFEDND